LEAEAETMAIMASACTDMNEAAKLMNAKQALVYSTPFRLSFATRRLFLFARDDIPRQIVK
jgi:hypothetical protein